VDSQAQKALNELSAASAAALIADGELTSEELVRACLDHALSRESEIHAWAYLESEQAIAEARARDRAPGRGPLHGVPVAIKDAFDVAGMRAGYGSPIYQNNYPSADAASVALLRAAGAVIIGKTAAVEFSASQPTKTRNPRNPAHTPGGSSSGSAAAVADLQVPIATGAQTGSSVIRPAAYCGIVGFKASFGLLCLAGSKMCAWSLDTLGVLARDVDDAALMYSALSGGAGRLTAVAEGRPRIGLFEDPFAGQAETSARSAPAFSAATLMAEGFSVRSIEAPPGFDRMLEAQRIIARYEMARSLAYEWECRRDLLSEQIQEEIAEGWAISSERYRQAHTCAGAVRRAMDSVFDDVDVLLTIATTGEAPKGLSSTGRATFNSSWTLLGNPCLCLPAGVGPHRLPIAVQLVAGYASDRQFLQFARQIADALNTHDR
jgi:Asp-tRNA(Asn)/Glu-tRNA(Gln) amidotransferase A subunit family amidase